MSRFLLTCSSLNDSVENMRILDIEPLLKTSPLTFKGLSPKIHGPGLCHL